MANARSRHRRNTILVGVDGSKHSDDTIAFAHQLAQRSSGLVVVACAFRDDGVRPVDGPGRRAVSRRDAEHTAQRLSLLLEQIDGGRIRTRAVAGPSPSHALHDLAVSEHAAIVIVGSSRPGLLGQVVPHGTGARLLHDAPCAVAVVPDGYRDNRGREIRRIGVAFDGSPESTAALAAAVAAVHGLGAELEVITVLPTQILATATMMSGPGYIGLDENGGRAARENLDAIVAGMPSDVIAEGTILRGSRAHRLALRSRRLDLLLIGSRGYNLVHGALVGGVSGPLLRDAACPVIAVPRGVQARLDALFGGTG